MKYLKHLGLAASLVACQANPVHVQQPNKALNQALQPQAPQASPAQVHTAPHATIRQSPTGQLHFSIQYPPQPEAGFQAKALNYQKFSRFRVSIVGIGLSQALYPAGTLSSQNHTLPATCAATSCALNTSISNVPSGENRLALIVAYDQQGIEIPGSTLAAVFDVLPSDTALTVRLSHLSSPVGRIAESLLNESEFLMLARLDSAQLQAQITALTGAQGTFPNFTYSHHPSLVHLPNLLADLKQAQGDASLLNLAANPTRYLIPAAQVTGSVTGLQAGDQVRLRLNDPGSSLITLNADGIFEFPTVQPGTWQLIVEPLVSESTLDTPTYYTVSNVPVQVVVAEAQTLALAEPILLQKVAPTIQGLLSNTVAEGEPLVLTGQNFHPDPAQNKIRIYGRLSSQYTNCPPPAACSDVFGTWTVSASEISQHGDLQHLTFPMPEQHPNAKWTHLRVGSLADGFPFSISLGAFQVVNLNQAVATPGESILINGQHFSEQAADHTIEIAGVSIPTENITVLASGQLQVQLPVSLPVGNTSVIVYKNGVEAVIHPSLNIVAPVTWSSWQSLGSDTEHVLSIATSTRQPERVWFGSQYQASDPVKKGGIWLCQSNGQADLCDNIKPGTEVGSIQALMQLPHAPQTLYAGSENKGVLMCSAECETAANWQASNKGLGNLNVRALGVDPQQPKHLYAATANGVYFSSDSGANWQAYNQGFDANHLNLFSLAIYRPHVVSEPVLYAGTRGGGVYRKQGNASWATINTGIFSQDSTSDEGTQYLGNVEVTALTPHPTNPEILYGGGTGQHSIIFGTFKVGIWRRSETGGLSNWTQLGRNGQNGFPNLFLTPGTGLSSMQILDLEVDPGQTQTLYAATRLDGAQTGGIYRSTNAGSSWSALGNSFTDATVLSANQLYLYAGTPTGLYRAQ